MKLLDVVNAILSGKGKQTLNDLDSALNLRNDLGFDSFDLAELTVRIEDIYDVDIFKDGVVSTIGEIENIVNGK